MSRISGGLVARIRRDTAPAAKRLLFNLGAYEALRRVKPSASLAILRYHAVCGPEGHVYVDPDICVTPEAFERHVEYFTSCYRVIPLPEAIAYLRDGKSLPPNALAITFDDGYADNLPAARLLHKHGVSATFYITAGCLSDEAPFWPSEIRQLVARVPGPVIRLAGAGADVVFRSDTPAERRVAVRGLSKLFKAHPIPVRERLRDELRAAAGGGAVASCMLTWDELREMHALGMTIGAHTVTHPNLPSAGLDDARVEITGSKARLESELGARVTMFSYPNGGAERYMTPEIATLVRQAGFEAATTSWNGFASANSDLFALERVQVTERLEELTFALEIERFAFKPSGRAPQVDARELR